MSDDNNRRGLSNEDFKFVRDAMLAAYRPILEEELRLSSSAEELQEGEDRATTCEEEIQLARDLFERFFTESVAYRVLPSEGRERLGKPESWAWCYRHILCCLVFGWLVCRGPRTYKGFSYYLYQYWRCVREALGQPVSQPPTGEEARDFRTLVQILASAYAPTLKAQVADLEYPFEIPAGIASGAIDCFQDSDQFNSVFERLLSPEAAPALFGSKAYSEFGKEPVSRACRCYCICALEFGCCLARARTSKEMLRCLRQFEKCLARCFNPLVGEIDTPSEGACTSLTIVSTCGDLTAVEITGTAAGSAFTHYTLTYSYGGPAIDTAVVYPDCSTPPASASSTAPVTSGILGYMNAQLLPFGVTTFTVILDVYGSGGLHLHLTRDFELENRAVEISSVATISAFFGTDPFNTGTTIKLIKTTIDPSTATPEQSVGGAFWVSGSAYTIGCGRQMTQYQLATFPAPAGTTATPIPVPTPPNVIGGAAMQSPVLYNDIPIHGWQTYCGLFPHVNYPINGDLMAHWGSVPCFFPILHNVTEVIATDLWNSGTLSTASQKGGRYVIVLEVDDSLSSPLTFPGTTAAVDQVAVWIDNWTPEGAINSIGGITGCGDLHLKDYYKSPAVVDGVAWDYPIDPIAPQAAPNDNFGSYTLNFQRNGGAGGPIPVATPGLRVPNVWPTLPAGSHGTLANWDVSSHSSTSGLDGGNDPGTCQPWQILRGTQCAYVVWLYVTDTTWVGNGDNHNAVGPILYAINVINDIPASSPTY